MKTGEYYAKRQNSFWPIMGALFGAGLDLTYEDRIAVLKARNVAVWDVLESSDRIESLDAAINPKTAVVNDFSSFFSEHPDVRLIAFNGGKAAALYERKVLPGLVGTASAIERAILASTSPAHTIPFEQKLARWSAALKVSQ